MLFIIYITIFAFINTFCKIKNRNRFYFITVIGFCLLALIVNPTPDMDLYKHYETLDFMRNASLDQILSMQYTQYEGLPVFAISFYLISKLGYNKILLVIAYFIDYGCQFKILSMVKEDFNISKKGERWAYNLIILLTNAMGLTGIRNMIAFTLCSMMIYYDVVRKKHRILSWVIYIAMCLFHESTLVIVLLRVAIMLPNWKIFQLIQISIIVWPQLINIISKWMVNFKGVFWSKLLQKMILYSYSPDQDFAALGGTMGFIRLFLELLIVVSVLVLVFIESKNNVIGTKYFRLYLFIALFCIGGIFVPYMLVRYIRFAVFLSIPLYARTWSICENNRNIFIVKICQVLIITSVIFVYLNLIISQYVFLP